MKEQTMLTPEQQYSIDQTVATMRIENMEPSKDTVKNLELIATGQKTVNQAVNECLERLKQ